MSKVALVELSSDVTKAFSRALELIGGIEELDASNRNVVVKVGVFNPKQGQHTTIPVTRAIVESFPHAPKVFLVESDNYRGTGTERLKIWKQLFSQRVVPFNLSEDTHTRTLTIAEEEMELSHILFKPNVLVSTHALRRYEKGSVLKNLLGCVPMRKKARFHSRLETVLLDLYEAVGGVDLAIVDATYAYPGPAARKRALTNLLIVSRDVVAADAVAAILVGLDPAKMPIIKMAKERGLVEGDISQIEILGSPLEEQRLRVAKLLKEAKSKQRGSSEKTGN